MQSRSTLAAIGFVLALAASSLSAQVVINEVYTGSPDFVELRNLGSSPVDVSGWTVATFESSNAATPSPEPTFTLPAGTIIAAGQLLVLQENGSPGGTGSTPCAITVGINYFWTATRNVEVSLLNASGVGQDYMFRNVSSTATGTPNAPAGQTFTGALTGAGDTIARNSDLDTDVAGDWSILGNGAETPCGFNAGQNVPPPPVELILTDDGLGGGSLSVVTTPPAAGSEYLNLFSFENIQPLGSGPILGLGIDVLPLFSVPAGPGNPIRGFLTAAGTFAVPFAPGSFPPGLTVQGVSVVLTPAEILISEAVEVTF